MAEKQKSEGFGYIAAESSHHFAVIIPAGKKEPVIIGEHFTAPKEKYEYALNDNDIDDSLRVILPRDKWTAISETVANEFNRRLKNNGLKSGRWKNDSNVLARLLGKELVLLAWAIEDADPALIPAAIQNWLGLNPEERWWLYTMTNAATGHAIKGKNKGWRKAVRYALTENPVSDNTVQPRHDLFLIMEETLNWSSQQDRNLKSKVENQE
jgi:hypothetical protein